MSGLIGGELLGAGSVRLAGDDGNGGGGGGTITEIESSDGSITVTNGTGPIVDLTRPAGSGDPIIIGKFTGVIPTGEGDAFTYLADPGQVVATAAGAEVDPQLYPTDARTFRTLRVTAVNGNASLNPYTVELYINGAATLQAVVIPAGAAPGTVVADGAHPLACAANDTFDLLASVAIGDITRIVSAVLEGVPGGGGGGGGSVSLVQSTDGSVVVTDGAGPTVELSVPQGAGGTLASRIRAATHSSLGPWSAWAAPGPARPGCAT